MNSGFRERQSDPGLAAALVRALGLHPVTARCLVNRGLADPVAAAAFLKPRLAGLRPPVGLAGFAEAVERIDAAVAGGQRVGVFGDYDADGATSAALLTIYLRGLGASVEPRVASRDRGYGFTLEDARHFIQAGCDLVITADTGTSDLPAIELLREQEIDTVVVDHHQVPEQADHPAILVNPHRPDSRYPFAGFASVGLCFYLMAALRSRRAGAGLAAPEVRPLLDLVAVGTICDMAPLTQENRILVRLGLELLSRRERPGLVALLDYAKVDRQRVLDETTVSWKLGPRLNAPGRLGDARAALSLLLATDASDAMAWAAECEQANDARRQLQEQITGEAMELAALQQGAQLVLVARRGWHPGVTGIVAARLAEALGRPCAVVALGEDGQGRGSMRASGVHVFRALAGAGDHLVRFGGHEGAGGFTVNEAELPALAARLRDSVEAARLSGDNGTWVDAVLPLGRIDARLAQELAALGPFGQGNPEPLMAAAGLLSHARRVGQDGAHLKLTLECSHTGRPMAGIAFRMGEREADVGQNVQLSFRPEISTFRGQSRLEVRVVELHVSGAGESP